MQLTFPHGSLAAVRRWGSCVVLQTWAYSVYYVTNIIEIGQRS